jgi:hypothetical protein
MNDIPARQAREMTVNGEEWSAEYWLIKFKYDVFEMIKETALKGNNSISIPSENWNNNDTKRKYLKSHLVALDYTVKVIDNIMTISW